jgi:hypothetical protein
VIAEDRSAQGIGMNDAIAMKVPGKSLDSESAEISCIDRCHEYLIAQETAWRC